MTFANSLKRKIKMTDCKQCEHSIVNRFGIACKEKRDWLTHQEYRAGKKILDDCPKNKEQK